MYRLPPNFPPNLLFILLLTNSAPILSQADLLPAWCPTLLLRCCQLVATVGRLKTSTSWENFISNFFPFWSASDLSQLQSEKGQTVIRSLCVESAKPVCMLALYLPCLHAAHSGLQRLPAMAGSEISLYAYNTLPGMHNFSISLSICLTTVSLLKHSHASVNILHSGIHHVPFHNLC